MSPNPFLVCVRLITLSAVLFTWTSACLAQETNASPSQAERERAEQELKQQEHQRILGVLPEFNITNIHNAAPLTPKEKFQLALKSTTDPVTVVVAGLDAGINQWQDSFEGYGQGAEGYGKRMGAAYADNFVGTLLGNALFPSLLHQDPRYFRKGSGSFKSRFFYAAASTFRCKGDNGKWQPNVSNLLGNLAAGGIANLYYPQTDRGAGLTFQRGFTVTLEGAFGGLAYEFWPDISHKLFHRNKN